MSDFQRQLEKLLSEHVAKATERTAHILNNFRDSSSALILYGAGMVGRRAAKILGEAGYPPVCFSDGNPDLWGTYIDKLPVMSPAQAIEKFGLNSLFIVTVFNREFHSDFRKISAALLQDGVKNVLPYPYLAWQYSDALLPHFAQGQPKDVLPFAQQIREAFALFHSERDQEVFLEMARVSLIGDYQNFTDPDPAPTYFPNYIINNMKVPVHLADCGAYDGDTLQNFLENAGGDKLGSWHAFEPDPETFKKLTAFVATLPSDIQRKVICHQAGTGEKNGKVNFSAEASESSKIVDKNHDTPILEINCVTLDEIFTNAPCNFIKLDVEGYELETLRGANNLLKKSNPVIAASVYHKPCDFFEIPLFLSKYSSLQSEIKNTFVMRRYMSYFYECVCYRY